eukprot:14108299-Alexandrium_andersonii.AAC.1
MGSPPHTPLASPDGVGKITERCSQVLTIKRLQFSAGEATAWRERRPDARGAQNVRKVQVAQAVALEGGLEGGQ